MTVQIEQVLEEKIVKMVEYPLPNLTRRNVVFSPLKGKALAVLGMRRAGKTCFLHQCRADLAASGRPLESMLYFNFEDERLVEMTAGDLHLIPETLQRLYPKNDASTPTTLFLDEIQLVSGWERFVRRLLDSGDYELFLSGSSAKMLSREIASSMRGRAWEVDVFPFCFEEFLRHHGHAVPDNVGRLTSEKSLTLDHHFAEYLRVGGFPEAQGLDLTQRRQLLQGYVDVALLRDVIERHELSNVTALRWLTRRLLASPAELFSISKFASDLKSQGIAASKDTLHEYLAHLEDAFLLQTVPVATDSEKRRQVNPRKVYPADPGLIPVFDRSAKANVGHALETAVFNQLQRFGCEIAYVKTARGYEVDFLARFPDGRQELIQVSATVDDPETLHREVRALQDAAADFPSAKLRLLTLETRLPFPEVPDEVAIQATWKWIFEPCHNA